MKQHVTAEQLGELSPEERMRLNREWRDNGQIVNLLNETDVNIGQMIEFLGNEWHFSIEQWGLSDVCIMPDNESLCDSLWKAVKEKLEK